MATVSLYGLTVLAGLLPPGAAWAFKVLLDTVTAPGGSGATRVVSLAVIAALMALAVPLVNAVTSYVVLAIHSAVTVMAADSLFRAVNRQAGLRRLEQPVFLDRMRLAEQAAATAPNTVNDFALTGVQVATTLAGFGAVLLVIWPPVAMGPERERWGSPGRPTRAPADRKSVV